MSIQTSGGSGNFHLPSVYPPAVRTVWELIFRQAVKTPNAAAIIAPGRSPSSYSNLERNIIEFATALRAAGVDRNSRVALVLPNGPVLATAFLAVASCASCTPLNPEYTAEDFEFLLDDLQARALIVLAGSDSPVQAVARRLGIQVVEINLNPDAPAGLITLSRVGELPIQGLPDLARAEDIALVLYTSGTTGNPKQVPLTHANLCASAYHIAATLQLSTADRCLNIMPLFHIHGLAAAVLATLAGGGSVACTSGFAGDQFFEWLDALRPTWYTCVPAMHQAILAEAGTHSEAIRRNPLRFIRSSSASLPPLMMAALERCFNAPVIEAYGMTEAAHQISSNPLPPRLRKTGSVGLAAGPEVAIANSAGKLLSRGERGEIVIRGANVSAGYDTNSGVYTPGWFHTGDQGWLDADGFLYITGRFKEMINRGGEKISPHEIDAAIESHPGIRAAATFGIPHPTLGEEVVAAVVKEGNAAIEESDILDRVRQRMGPTGVPRRIYFVDELPRTESGKVRRSELPRILDLDKPATKATAQHAPATTGAPASPLEAALIGLWASILEVSDVRLHDDFFLLGGDSLRGARLLTSVKAVFGVDLTILELFGKAATVAGMARAIEAVRSADATVGHG